MQIDNTEKLYNITKQICKKNKIYPKNILELGFQNTDLLNLFSEKSKIYGITQKEKIIEKIKEENITGKFYKQKIINFRVPFQFQLIYYISETLNKITKNSDQENLFKKIFNHLEPYGLFIFRIYTEKYYKDFNGKTEILKDNNTGDYIINQKIKNKNKYQNNIKIFKKEQDDKFSLSELSTTEIIFSMTKIKKILQKYFENIQILNTKGQKYKPTDSEIFIVCQKGWN